MTSEEADVSKDTADTMKVAFYSASVEAWFTSALELDKSLLALSAGGIGLLVTLFSTSHFDGSFLRLSGFFSIVFFLACTIVILVIFRGNKLYLERILREGKADSDSMLAKLDLGAHVCFGLGIACAVSIGVYLAFFPSTSGVENMSTNKPVAPPVRMAADSVNNAPRLMGNFGKSFNGASNLMPAAVSKPAAAAPVAQAPAAQAPAAPAPKSSGQ